MVNVESYDKGLDIKPSLYQLTNGEMNLFNYLNESGDDIVFDIGAGMDIYLTLSKYERVLFVLMNYLGNAYPDFIFEQAYGDYNLSVKDPKKNMFDIEDDIDIIVDNIKSFDEPCNKDSIHHMMNSEVMSVIEGIDLNEIKKHQFNLEKNKKFYLFEPNKDSRLSLLYTLYAFEMLRNGYISLFVWESLRRTNNFKKYRNRPIFLKYPIYTEHYKNIFGQLNISNCKVIDKGVGDSIGNVGYDSTYESCKKIQNVTDTIEIETLNNFTDINDISKIKFLKIDVEGYDYNVLKGSDNIFDMIEYIQLELSPDYMDFTLLDVHELLGTGWNYYLISPHTYYKLEYPYDINVPVVYNVLITKNDLEDLILE